MEQEKTIIINNLKTLYFAGKIKSLKPFINKGLITEQDAKIIEGLKQ